MLIDFKGIPFRIHLSSLRLVKWSVAVLKRFPVFRYSVVYIIWSFVIIELFPGVLKSIRVSLIRPNWPKLVSLAHKMGHFSYIQICKYTYCSQGTFLFKILSCLCSNVFGFKIEMEHF